MLKLVKYFSFIIFIIYTLLVVFCVSVDFLRFNKNQIISLDVELSGNNKFIDLFTRPIVSITAKIPESLQLDIGLSIFFDNFTRKLTRDAKDKISNSIKTMYAEMNTLTEWRSLPSSTGYSALDLLGISPQRAQAYIYVPKSFSNNQRKALIFLHGSLGNLKAYPYIWSKYAERTGTIIICPGYGFGNWNRKDDMIQTVLNHLPQDLKISREETIIVGLSAGGVGVVNEIKKHPEYKAALFISAVIPDSLATDKVFISKWKNKPLIITNGNDDYVVTAEYATKKSVELSILNPKLVLYEGESHFLLMTGSEKIFRELDSFNLKDHSQHHQNS